ncbi:MAG: hypothetical protein HY903_04485 [Deltaproteobacteria bacterium]|nr:hypothetical protein [Deltaproteobacteria bacterium]
MSNVAADLALHLAFAEHQKLTVQVDVSLGVMDIGCIRVQDGAVVHAELPGAAGLDALALMGRLPGMHLAISTKNPSAAQETVVGSWRSVLPAQAELSAEAMSALSATFSRGSADLGRAAPLTPTVRAPTPPAPIPSPAPSPETSAAADAAYEKQFAEAMAAYLRRDYVEALELFAACLNARPDDRRVLHNIERLQARDRPAKGSG